MRFAFFSSAAQRLSFQERPVVKENAAQNWKKIESQLKDFRLRSGVGSACPRIEKNLGPTLAERRSTMYLPKSAATTCRGGGSRSPPDQAFLFGASISVRLSTTK